MGMFNNTNEEWVWITGYKGTDKNMQCRGYQFEMHTPFHIPENEEIVECKNGFHLCKNLYNVFNHYGIENGNRFFEVRALVRKTDAEKKANGYYNGDKMAARSIEFVRELEVDEILKEELTGSKYDTFPELQLSKWTDEAKKMAIEVNLQEAARIMLVEHLTTFGYSKPFALFILENGAYTTAVAVGAQTNLSMDMKAMFIHSCAQKNMAKVSYSEYKRSRSYSRSAI